MTFQFPTVNRVLVCPLNWGLGHATRCVPIIAFYLERHTEVHIASDGEALAFLQKRFGKKCTFHELPSYNVSYKSRYAFIDVLLRFKSIRKAIVEEKKVLNKLVQTFKPELVISDNRYGCYSKEMKSVCVTHQLTLQPAFSNFVFGKKLESYLGNFDEIWVPDFKLNGLAGKLSTSSLKNVQYIKPLCRLRIQNVEGKRGSVLLIATGPEPERSKWIDTCLNSLKQNNSVTIISNEYRGEKTSSSLLIGLQENEVEEQIQQAEIIICRAGYTSVMDLCGLTKKRIILIPTKGQLEQEYLAKHLNGRKPFEYRKSSEGLSL